MFGTKTGLYTQLVPDFVVVKPYTVTKFFHGKIDEQCLTFSKLSGNKNIFYTHAIDNVFVAMQ